MIKEASSDSLLNQNIKKKKKKAAQPCQVFKREGTFGNSCIISSEFIFIWQAWIWLYWSLKY